MTSGKLLSAAVGVAILIATPAFATTVHKGKASHAYASQIQQPHDANTVFGWDGRVLGADPDPNIRFQLMRDQNWGGY